jgi:hypothetical protein
MSMTFSSKPMLQVGLPVSVPRFASRQDAHHVDNTGWAFSKLRILLMLRLLTLVTAGPLLFAGSARAQVTSACDLNKDGAVNVVDAQLAVNMYLGLLTCTANIEGAGVCNTDVVQRLVTAATGGTCVTGVGSVPHTVSLNWTASTSGNVVGYNIYRATTSGGPYTTKVNTSPVAAISYADTNVLAGQTYYYVATAVDINNNESGYSGQAIAIVPSP